MQISLILLETILKLFIILPMGYGLVKSGILRAADSKCISAVMVYLVLPCTIIHAFQIDYTPAVRSGLLFAAAVSAAVHVIFIVGTKLIARPLRLNVIEQLTVIYTNAGNLVIPIVMALLGQEYVVYSCSFVAVQLILLWTHGKHRLCAGERISLKKILLNVNILSILAGLLLMLFHLRLPVVLDGTVEMMANMVGPMGMLLAGMLIAEVPLREVFLSPRGYLTALLRLFVFPAILVLLFALLHVASWLPDGRNLLLTVYLACITPACATLTSMAQMYQADAVQAGRLFVLTTVCSIVSMPLMIGFFAALI